MRESGSFSIFITGCQELIEKLRFKRDDVSADLKKKAELLSMEFERWRGSPPSGEKKSETISKLIDLTREVNEHLSVMRDK
jgi:hypothetical protein